MVPVGKKRRDPEELARLVETGLARGLDLVDAFRSATARYPGGGGPGVRSLERQHRKAVEQHRKAVKRYERTVSSLRTQATAGTAVAGVAGTVGAIDVVTEAVTSQAGVYGPSWMWLGGAVIGGVTAFAARRRLRETKPPAPLTLPLPPPAPLPPTARGAAESARLSALRVQLAQVVPAVARLHPGAAEELLRADSDAAPAMNALVERLAVLHRIEQDMPGSQPAVAAGAAGEEVRVRLASGVTTYERLLAASATLLAAPDPGRSADEVLGPAVDGLTAYAHGLTRSAQAFDQQP